MEPKSKGTQQQKDQQHQPPSQSPSTPKSILSKKQSNSTKKVSTPKPEDEGHMDQAGDSEKQMKNLQNVKQQVRIEDSVNNQQVAMVTPCEGQGDQEDFDSTWSLKYFEIEVSDQLIERCATQLSNNERVVAGRRGHNSADLGTARHLAVIKNE